MIILLMFCITSRITISDNVDEHKLYVEMHEEYVAKHTNCVNNCLNLIKKYEKTIDASQLLISDYELLFHGVR